MTAIRMYRDKAGLTQVKLAEIIGVTQGAIAMWENGDREPDIKTLKKLSEALNCTVDELLATVNISDEA